MEIQEYEYQGEKGILLKDRDTMTNVFLTDYEIIELLKFFFNGDTSIVEEILEYR